MFLKLRIIPSLPGFPLTRSRQHSAASNGWVNWSFRTLWSLSQWRSLPMVALGPAATSDQAPDQQPVSQRCALVGGPRHSAPSALVMNMPSLPRRFPPPWTVGRGTSRICAGITLLPLLSIIDRLLRLSGRSPFDRLTEFGSILTLAEMGKCHGRKHGCKVLPKKVGVVPEISRWPFVE
jgi:hypothetical protein